MNTRFFWTILTMLIIIVIIAGYLVFLASNYRNLPCENYINTPIGQIPARCAEYFGIKK